MNELFSSLQGSFYRRGDIYRVVQELKTFFEMYFFSDHFAGKNSVQALHQYIDEHEKLSPHIKDTLYALPQHLVERFSGETMYDLLAELETFIDQAPKLVLYVPMELESEQYARIGSWVRQHINPGLLLDTKYDATVVGGCAFVWNGVYYDYSLRYFIRKHQAEIIDSVRNEQQYAR